MHGRVILSFDCYLIVLFCEILWIRVPLEHIENVFPEFHVDQIARGLYARSED